MREGSTSLVTKPIGQYIEAEGVKSMVTREDVVIEVRKVPEKYLDELYQIIKDFEARTDGEEADQNVMAALRQIKFSASSDFSTTADLYQVPDKHAR